MKKVLLPLIILVVAAGILVGMIATRPEAKRRERGVKPLLVKVQSVAPSAQDPIIEGHGTVVAARQVTLQPEVAGRVVWVSPDLVPGGRFKKGQPMLRIDRRNYETVVAQRQATVKKAEMGLQMEQGKKRVAEREWKLVRSKRTKAGKSLALREPQIAEAEANHDAAEQGLARAKLDVERTTIRAPFNSVILERTADIGQVASPQSRFAMIAGTDSFWVRIAIPADRIAMVQTPGASAAVLQNGQKWNGRVVRLLSDLDPIGRMARLLVEVDDPLEGDTPLFLGAFADVAINGRSMSDVFAIPDKALRGSDEVWLMTSDNKLEIRTVKIAWRSRRVILISEGLEAGDKLVTSGISVPVPGMRLRTTQTRTSTKGQS